MPLQNRVTPEGDIVAVAARGTMMGNRGGALHDAERRLGRRRWVSKQWICCRLAFNDRHRQVMAPNRYTELFFLDEATALAAGHRPCFECRRSDFMRFAELWGKLHGRSGRASVAEMDGVLHAERVDAAGGKRTWRERLDALPVGTFAHIDDQPVLVAPTGMRAWSMAGYGAASPLPGDRIVEVLTPRTAVAVMEAGYSPMLHASAKGGPVPRQSR